MLNNILEDRNLILASGSPRRQNFFKQLGVNFTINVRAIDEVYPPHLKGSDITDFLARLKASAFSNLAEKDILVTSDTIVWLQGKAIGKPKSPEDAHRMLRELSGKKHQVYTSVCFTTSRTQEVVNDCTDVWFRELTDEEIAYYIKTHEPFDKAGSYGIQDWLGYIGIEKIEGCFFNVMGLPTRKVYEALATI